MIYVNNWPILMLAGAGGALIKDILKDNKITLPKVKKGVLYLGCLGGMIIGSMAGYLVDNDPVTAFLGGYAGSQIIQSLVTSKFSGDVSPDKLPVVK